MLKESLIFSVAFLVVLCNSTQVIDCSTGKPIEDYAYISNCQVPPCVLKKRTEATIEQKFVPDHEISDLETSVYAKFLGGNFPFPGVNGKSACGQIYHVDGSKASCPLKSGTQYVYKNSFPIIAMYPTMSTEIEWALKEGDTKITCFKVRARISN